VDGAVSNRAGWREWVGLAVLGLPTFVVAIDIFVLLVALPRLATDLGADSNQQLWIVDMYGFLLAGFLLTMGTLGDRLGRRRLLLAGAAAFGVASLLTAYATSPELLIAARALLGIAGATLMPSTLALITTMFQEPRQRATAIGMWGGMFTLGALTGPVIGGLMLVHFWWGSVFLLGVPVAGLLLVVGPRLLPEYRDRTAGRIDLTSVVLTLATALPVVYGIKELARHGWRPLPVATLLLGVVAAVAFGRRQRRLADPLLDLRMFRNRNFSTALGGQLCYSVVGGGIMLFMMLYFQLVVGMSTLQAGLAMVPGMAGATLGFLVGPRLATRIRPAYVIAAGMAGSCAALLAFTQVGASAGTATLVIGFAVFSFCGAPLVALGTNLVIGSAAPEKAGAAGSMAQLSNEFGGTLGGALLGTVGFAVYRRLIAGELPPELAGSPAAAARDSVVGAAGAAGQLPEPAGAALLAAAHRSFADALNVVAGTGALILAGVAVVVATVLRPVPPLGQAPSADPADQPPVPRTG
jgi:DHA2 family multidrug resistance protein-like MFS transporter